MNRNSRTLRRQVGAILVALGTAVLTGTSSAQDKITIGHSQPNLGWPYIAAFTRALEAAVAEHANVELVTRSADGDIAKQANDIDSLIAVPVDFLFVTSLDGNAVIPSLMAAGDAGIPILAVSNEPAEPGQALLVAYSGPDDYVQGVIAAELMHEALGGEGNVVIIEGTPGQSTTAARNKGFDDGLAQLDSNIKVLARQTANWNPVNAKAVTEDFITQFGDKIDGLFSQDDNTAASAAEVLVAAGMKDVKVVGTGGSINGVAAIRNGLVYGTMDQSPTTDAQQALRIALDYLDGKKPAERRVIIPMPKITAANVSEFKGEW